MLDCNWRRKNERRPPSFPSLFVLSFLSFCFFVFLLPSPCGILSKMRRRGGDQKAETPSGHFINGGDDAKRTLCCVVRTLEVSENDKSPFLGEI